MINLKDEAEMIAFGKRIGETIFPHSIITLTGDLGLVRLHSQKELDRDLKSRRSSILLLLLL